MGHILAKVKFSSNVEGERATTIVVFAEEDAEVLGVYALEYLSLEVDPITKELRKSEAILAL